MSVPFVLLGVLAEGPAHGYDLKRAHDARFPGAKPLAYGQVYAALGRLERDGLVEVVETGSEGGPERMTYAMTEAGSEALEGWLGEYEQAGPYAADDLVRKTVTALRLGHDAARFLAGQRQVHLAAMRQLIAVQESGEEVEARIVIDHAIEHLDADLRWLTTAESRVQSAHQNRKEA